MQQEFIYATTIHNARGIESLIVFGRSNPNKPFFLRVTTSGVDSSFFLSFFISFFLDPLMKTASVSILGCATGYSQISRQLMIQLSLGASGSIDARSTIFIH